MSAVSTGGSARGRWIALAVAAVALLGCMVGVPAFTVVGYYLAKPAAWAKVAEPIAEAPAAKAPHPAAPDVKDDPLNEPAFPAAPNLPLNLPPQLPGGAAEPRPWYTPDLSVKGSKYGPLEKHPWWRAPQKMTAAKIDRMVLAISTLGRDRAALAIDSDGSVASLSLTTGRDTETVATIDSGREHVVITIVPGRGPILALAKARSLLVLGVDGAYASEELYRKTGHGVGTLDQLDKSMAPGFFGPNLHPPQPAFDPNRSGVPGPKLGLPKKK